MQLFHGSDHIIEKPAYHYGNRHNDYGYGFYCTEFADMAREWSSSPDSPGYLNEYDLDVSGLSMLDLNKYGILTWLTILLENRTFKIDTPLAKEAYAYLKKEFLIECESFDLIKGYRADDSYFSFARDFINGTISISQLNEAMRLGELGNQIALKSERAFKKISFVGAERVDSRIWYPKRMARDENARKKYFSSETEFIRGQLYITQILNEEIKKDDARLQ